MFITCYIPEHVSYCAAFREIGVINVRLSWRSEQVTRPKGEAEKKRDQNRRESAPDVIFNKEGVRQRRRKRWKPNRKTHMQEASDELYSTEEEQAGETEKQEYSLLNNKRN